VYSDIRSALGQKIEEQTAGVGLGDPTGLLKAIKLSVHHYELTNKHVLDVEYGRCEMAGAGNNDMMTFLSALSNHIRRLETAGVTIEDGKKQSVLLEGLDQTIFEHFIADARRTPYANYTSLQKAVEEHAALPRMLQKLRALKPGNPQSALPTRSTSNQHQTQQQQQTESDSQRLEKIEAVLVSLTKTHAAAPKKQECFKFKKGTCTRGDKCPYEHVHAGNNKNNKNNNNNNNNDNNNEKFCALHRSTTHNTSECNTIRNNPALMESYNSRKHGQVINKTTTEDDDGYSFMFPTRVSFPKHILAMRDTPKIDLWCVDGAATTFATYDRGKCFNVRPCKVTIHGPNSKDSFICKEMGDARIDVIDKTTGKSTQLTATDVLISEAFPFHIFSEILAFEKNCTAIKSLGSWQFLNPSKKPLFHASQRLLNSGSGHSDVKLYFIDEAPQASTAAIHATARGPDSAEYDAGWDDQTKLRHLDFKIANSALAATATNLQDQRHVLADRITKQRKRDDDMMKLRRASRKAERHRSQRRRSPRRKTCRCCSSSIARTTIGISRPWPPIMG